MKKVMGTTVIGHTPMIMTGLAPGFRDITIQAIPIEAGGKREITIK